METAGKHENISTVNILICAFDGADGVEKCLDMVKKWDLKLTQYTCNCVLLVYLRGNNLGKAMEVYAEMGRKGWELDIFSYNMLLHALAIEEKVEQPFKLFEDMKRKHCEPDEYTYTILIRTIGKLGKANEALALFDEMLSKDCKPNSMSYNTNFEALAT